MYWFHAVALLLWPFYIVSLLRRCDTTEAPAFDLPHDTRVLIGIAMDT